MVTCPKCSRTYADGTAFCAKDGTVLAAMSEPRDETLSLVIDGKYAIKDVLGEGGMGTVYRADHILLGKTVAIKLIRPELGITPNLVKRFQREARALSNLAHPNIVQVYDLGQTEKGELFIAMEFVKGRNLKSLIGSLGAIPEWRAVSIGAQIAKALAAAHANQVIHRDLKPHNVLMTEDADGRELAKLLDFGIAKTVESGEELTAFGAVIGTPHYMSPEQASGTDVDARADIYSFGVVLYEMLVGRVPFDGASAAAILVKQLHDRPVAPTVRQAHQRISPAVERIVMRCLEKRPADRFDSARALLTALDAVPRSGPPPELPTMAGTTPISPLTSAAPMFGASAETMDEQPSPGKRNWLLPLASVAVLAAGVGTAFVYWNNRQPGTTPPPVTAAPPAPQPQPASPAPPQNSTGRSSAGQRQNAQAPAARGTTPPPNATSGATTPPPLPDPNPERVKIEAPQPVSAPPGMIAADASRTARGRCDSGDVKSCLSVIAVLRAGPNAAENLAETMKYMQKACDFKHVDSCNDLGAIYEKGKDVPRNSLRARDLYLKAYEAGLDEAAADKVTRAGRDVSTPAVVSQPPAPAYPIAANIARIEGWVLVEATIDPAGTVSKTTVVHSVPELDLAALAAAKQYRFAPTRVDGKAVSVVMIIPVEFSLNKKGGRP